MVIRLSLFFAALIAAAACADSDLGFDDWAGDTTPTASIQKNGFGDSANFEFQLKIPSECENPCSLSVQTAAPIGRVIYESDGWPLGNSRRTEDGYAISYTFNTLGARIITAIGVNNVTGDYVEATKTTHVRDSRRFAEDRPVRPDWNPSPSHRATRPSEVPYFSQYDNALYPEASCQNTSMAMVLKYSGWTGVPDDITRAHGKDYAQSPAGLARLFNTYSANAGLPFRITPETNGSLAGLKAELDQGHPVIIHGYFTRAGHVVVVVGYDANGYYVNDPAGRWSEIFKGGYGAGGSGRNVYYQRAAFEAAIATADGYSPLPLWYHPLR